MIVVSVKCSSADDRRTAGAASFAVLPSSALAFRGLRLLASRTRRVSGAGACSRRVCGVRRASPSVCSSSWLASRGAPFPLVRPSPRRVNAECARMLHCPRFGSYQESRVQNRLARYQRSPPIPRTGPHQRTPRTARSAAGFFTLGGRARLGDRAVRRSAGAARHAQRASREDDRGDRTARRCHGRGARARAGAGSRVGLRRRRHARRAEDARLRRARGVGHLDAQWIDRADDRRRVVAASVGTRSCGAEACVSADVGLGVAERERRALFGGGHRRRSRARSQRPLVGARHRARNGLDVERSRAGDRLRRGAHRPADRVDVPGVGRGRTSR